MSFASAAAPGSRWVAVGARERVLAALALLLLVVAFYAPTLGGHYQADDFGLAAAMIGPSGGVEAGHVIGPFVDPVHPDRPWRFFRPLWSASFALEAGPLRTAPWASRLLSLALHAGGALCIGLLLRRRGFAALTSYAAAAAFALGPGSVQAVAWISARCDLLAATFGLAALLARATVLEGGPRRARARVLSLVALTAAILGKESGYAFVPALCVLHVVDAPGRGWRARLAGARGALDVALLGCALFAWRAVMVGGLVGGYGTGGVQPLPSLRQQAEKVFQAVFPAALVPDPRWAAVIVAVLAIAALAVAWRAVSWSAGRRALPLSLTAFALLVATLATAVPVWVPHYADPEAARVNHQPAAAWALAAGVALGALWGARRGRAPRVAALAAAVAWMGGAVAVAWPLVLGHARAGRVAGELVAGIRDALDEKDERPLLLWGVPDVVGPGLVGRNLLGGTLTPLVVEPPRPFDVYVVSPMGAVMHGGWTLDVVGALVGGRVDVRRWDGDARRFRATDETLREVLVRGRVQRSSSRAGGDGDGGGDERLWLSGAALELTGASAVLDALRSAAATSRCVEVVLPRGTGPGARAEVLSVAPAAATFRIDERGVAVWPLEASGPPGATLFLLVGDRAGWRPLGEIGTCLVDAARLRPAGRIPAGGRLTVQPARLFDAPRFVQGLTVTHGGVLRLGERVTLP